MNIKKSSYYTVYLDLLLTIYPFPTLCSSGLLAPPSPLCLSPHTHSQLLADRDPVVFLLNLPLLQHLCCWIIHCRCCFLNKHTHTLPFTGTCVAHAHTEPLCLTPTHTQQQARACPHTKVKTCSPTDAYTHTHINGTALFSISLCKMGQWGDFITLCKTHDSLTVSQYINPSIPSLSPSYHFLHPSFVFIVS